GRPVVRAVDTPQKSRKASLGPMEGPGEAAPQGPPCGCSRAADSQQQQQQQQQQQLLLLQQLAIGDDVPETWQTLAVPCGSSEELGQQPSWGPCISVNPEP
ncbi:hypothetical protein ETH_00034165, partial [Eimeria tenella]